MQILAMAKICPNQFTYQTANHLFGMFFAKNTSKSDANLKVTL